MTVGIVGLGLIGGSMAKAIKENTSHKVYCTDIKQSEVFAAQLTDSCDGFLTDENIGECDFLIICVYPQGTVDFVTENAEKIRKGATVIDCGGTKRKICSALYETAKNNGFTFIGGHPMAGTQFSGFSHSRANLYKGATMLLAAQDSTSIEMREQARDFFLSLGFSRVQFTSPKEHDRIIAFTSQLPHVVSNAYVKSPTALSQRGFSAGSYKDLSRVAKLNETMWTELFLENRDNLIFEIDTLIEKLGEYSDALKSNDAQKLTQLLNEGTKNKERADKVGVGN